MVLQTAALFLINAGVSYLLSRAQAPDGPRLKELDASSGEYGIPMQRMHGETVRVPGIFIAQDNIKESKHKVSSSSGLVGAATGALTGLVYGGPVGAVIGGVLGGLFGSSQKQYYYTYSDTFAHLLADRTNDDPIEGVSKIWAGGKLIFNPSQSTIVSSTFGSDGKLVKRKYGKNKYFKSLTIYTGHSEQTLDPILEDELGEVSAYVFSAYAVVEDLQLAAFGNAVPALEYLVSVKAGETLASTAEVICQAGGIDPTREVSTTSLIDRVVKGYLINRETTCWDALKPLLPVYGVDAAEVSGQIRFYRRAQYMRATIPLDDMGAHIYGDTPPTKHLFRRANDISLPQETSLTFIDPSRDYQVNTMASQRSEGNAQSNVTINLPLVMTASEGAAAAALMHWDAWLGRTQLNFSLMDSWIGIETGVAYGIPFADQIVPYRVTRKTRGANGIIEIEALSDESVTYTATGSGSSGTIPDEGSTLFPETRVMLLDMPIIGDGHDDYGFYAVMAGSEADWERGRIEMSGDGVTFATLIDDSGFAVMGDVTGTLAAGTTTGLDDALDTTSVLTVVLLHDGMELSDATDAELDGWANFAFVGKDGLGEYLQFKTATKVGTATWELTNLRRGRKGTDHAISAHVSGEEFALLGEDGVFRVQYSDTLKWGVAMNFRGVTLHQDADDADIIDFTNTGEGKRPYSPVNVEGAWDGSYNLTATFDSRSRLNAGGLGIDDNFEFDVEILNATPVRSMTVTAESFSYSAADQTTDGITPGDDIVGRVRQTSDVYDGRWRNFTLVGPNNFLALEDDATPLELEDGSEFELG